MTRFPAQPCDPDLSTPCDGSAAKETRPRPRFPPSKHTRHERAAQPDLQKLSGNAGKNGSGSSWARQVNRSSEAAAHINTTPTHTRCTEDGGSLGLAPTQMMYKNLSEACVTRPGGAPAQIDAFQSRGHKKMEGLKDECGKRGVPTCPLWVSHTPRFQRYGSD